MSKEFIRMYHLDALRAFLMISGVFVHSGTLENNFVFDVVQELSGLVRMEAFFLLSGYFSAMIICKRGYKQFIIKRIIILGLPLICTLILLNPITNAIVAYYHNKDVVFSSVLILFWVKTDLNGPMVWHLHLWFLMPLLIYSLIQPIITKFSVVCNFHLIRLNTRLTGSVYAFFIYLFPVVLVLLLRIFNKIFLNDLTTVLGLDFLVRELLVNFPFYLMGSFFFYHKDLFDKFSITSLPFVITAILLLVYSHKLIGSVTPEVFKVLTTCCTAFFAIVFTGFLIRVSKIIVPGVSKVALFLSNTSYTIYLFHYVIIYLIALVIRDWVEDGLLLDLTVVALTLLITTLIHITIISKIRIMRLMFNGKLE